MWITGQRDALAQRRGRYPPESTQHPARMLPASPPPRSPPTPSPGTWLPTRCAGSAPPWSRPPTSAATRPGSSSRAAGPSIAAANIRLARGQGASGPPWWCVATPALTELIPPRHGRFALVVTSPPYGPTVHGLVRPERPRTAGSTSPPTGTDTDRGNLAHRAWRAGRRVHRDPARLPRPAPPRRHGRGHRPALAEDGELVDLPAAVFAAGTRAGLVPVERCVALLAGLRGGRCRPAVVLPAPQPPPGTGQRHPDAPHRTRGRADLPQPGPFRKARPMGWIGGR